MAAMQLRDAIYNNTIYNCNSLEQATSMS